VSGLSSLCELLHVVRFCCGCTPHHLSRIQISCQGRDKVLVIPALDSYFERHAVGSGQQQLAAAAAWAAVAAATTFGSCGGSSNMRRDRLKPWMPTSSATLLLLSPPCLGRGYIFRGVFYAFDPVCIPILWDILVKCSFLTLD
jgi:hypothetical protein